MERNSATKSNGTGRSGRARNAVKSLLSRGRDEAVAMTAMPVTRPASATPARAPRPKSDVPLDLLESEYTPPITSSKASFRSDGADHQNDQSGLLADRWNDEDHYTNKSGDPRIGTHRRTHEPGQTHRVA